MKITEKDENGDYVTYEGLGEYTLGKLFDKIGCSGCLFIILFIIYIIYKISCYKYKKLR